MKKTLCFIAFLLAIIVCSSCDTIEPPESFPNIDNISNETSTAITNPNDIEAEKEYHRNIGITVIDSYDELSQYYNIETYLGLYDLTVDSIYRTKLDMDILRKAGKTVDEDYYDLICSFLTENTPKCLLPQQWSHNNALLITWNSYITNLALIDEDLLVSNHSLMDLFAFQCLLDAEAGSNIVKRLESYPILSEVIIGKKISVIGQRYETSLNRTVIDVLSDSSEKLLFRLGKCEIKYLDTDVVIVDKNEVISTLPSYEGVISIAPVNKYGIIGETIYYSVTSTAENIPNRDVSFSSSRLEDAVRIYFNKEKTDPISLKELATINSIFINGDNIFINQNGLTLDHMNAEIPAQNNDFSFEDIDYFPCLSSLTVKYNKTGNPSGTTLKYLDWLELVACDITDLSGIENCYIRTLMLRDNNINDASVLSTARALDSVNLSGNPLSKINMPNKAISQLHLMNTNIDSLDFAENLKDLFALNVIGTKITNADIVLKFPSLQYLNLPSGIDYSNIAEMKSLRELTVGEEIIK